MHQGYLGGTGVPHLGDHCLQGTVVRGHRCEILDPFPSWKLTWQHCIILSKKTLDSLPLQVLEGHFLLVDITYACPLYGALQASFLPSFQHNLMGLHASKKFDMIQDTKGGQKERVGGLNIGVLKV